MVAIRWFGKVEVGLTQQAKCLASTADKGERSLFRFVSFHCVAMAFVNSRANDAFHLVLQAILVFRLPLIQTVEVICRSSDFVRLFSHLNIPVASILWSLHARFLEDF